MQIVDQSHKILTKEEYDALEMIEVAGRTCYKSEDKITDNSKIAFCKKIIKRKHLAMIEFGDLIVRFITNRGVTHEGVRHRLCSFGQESTRYVKYDGNTEFIRPVWWDESTPAQQQRWKDSNTRSEIDYKWFLESGWRPEQARDVLPNCLKTELVVKANMREWRHIFAMRCAKTAHPQIVALMKPLLVEARKRFAPIFDDLNDDGQVITNTVSIESLPTEDELYELVLSKISYASTPVGGKQKEECARGIASEIVGLRK